MPERQRTRPRSPISAERPEVIVVGAGLIGLAAAAAISRSDSTVLLIGSHRPGEASRAAAGMLAPSVERIPGDAQRFAEHARDRYPAWLDWLAEDTGMRVPLNRQGILHAALDDAGAERLRQSLAPADRWLSPDDAAALEPALAAVAGAVFHEHDGAVDNVRLADVLEHYVANDQRAIHLAQGVARIDVGNSPSVILDDGSVHAASSVVIAAGAWSPRIAGLPRPIPIEPVRGQMLALDGTHLNHVVYAPHCYLVPRGDRTLVGSTMERVGFDSSTTESAADGLHNAASAVVPALRAAPRAATWAGLRPMTPDGLPILGRDPACPALIYACGHSRNGVLMAPLTGECVAALIAGRTPPVDLSPFAIDRFPSPSDAGRNANPI